MIDPLTALSLVLIATILGGAWSIAERLTPSPEERILDPCERWEED